MKGIICNCDSLDASQGMEVIHTYLSLFGGRAWSLVSLSRLIYINIF